MQKTVDRFFYMDAMRSVLMLMGVFAHSSYIYHPHREWIINSDLAMTSIGWLSSGQLAFRMQAFFVISGFFCALTITRYSPQKFLKIRLVRIAVPLFFTGLTLNLLQDYFLGAVGVEHFSLYTHFFEGEWVSHLWFLRNLLVYFAVAAVVAMLFGKHLGTVNNMIDKLTERLNIYVILGLFASMSVGLLMLAQLGYPLYSTWIFGFFKMYQINWYLPFFLVGILFYTLPELLRRFCSIQPLLLVLIICICIPILLSTSSDEFVILRFANVLSYALINWCAISLVFQFFRHFCNKPSKIWTFVADSSYSVYLFHHSFVVMFGFYAVKYAVHPVLAMSIFMPIIIVITLLIHVCIVKKVPLLTFFFNGKGSPFQAKKAA